MAHYVVHEVRPQRTPAFYGSYTTESKEHLQFELGELLFNTVEAGRPLVVVGYREGQEHVMTISFRKDNQHV